MLSTKIVEIYVEVDDFLKKLPESLPKLLAKMDLKVLSEIELINYLVIPNSRMSLSELMTIEIAYHFSGYQCFKSFYKECLEVHFRQDFPTLLSYNRFIELKKHLVFPLFCFMQATMQKKCTGFSFVDSSKLSVSHPCRVHQHKVFKDKARWGKTSVGWFWGFKLHLCISHKGDILGFTLSLGNQDDRHLDSLKQVFRYVFGLVLGDRGYQSETLRKKFQDQFLKMDSKLRKNTKRRLEALESVMVRKRALIESVFDLLKEHLGLEVASPRCMCNYFVNIFATLAAYTFYENKPSVFISANALQKAKVAMIA